MRSVLYILAILFSYSHSMAQCKQKWVRIGLDKRDTAMSDMDKNEFNVGEIKIQNHFIDSLINFLETKETRAKSNNLIFTNFKTFHYGAIEVLLKNTSKFSADTAAQKLYNFSLSKAHNGNDWDGNEFYFFTYTKKYGVIFKHFGNADSYQKEILFQEKCRTLTEQTELNMLFSRLSQ